MTETDLQERGAGFIKQNVCQGCYVHNKGMIHVRDSLFTQKCVLHGTGVSDLLSNTTSICSTDPFLALVHSW